MVLALVALAAAAALAACDLDFVEVQGSPEAVVTVRSNHGQQLHADVEVRHAGVEGPVTVRVAGSEAALVEEEGGTWKHRASLVVDSLRPTVPVEMHAGDDGVDLAVPLLARAGPASRADNGDLHLPIVGPAPLAGARTQWTLRLLNTAGQDLLTIHANVESLPVVVSASLVPEEAARADLEHRMTAELGGGVVLLSGAVYPVSLGVVSKTSWEIPEIP